MKYVSFKGADVANLKTGGPASTMSVQPQQQSWRDPATKSKDLRYLDRLQEFLEQRLSYLRGRADRVAVIVDKVGRAANLESDTLSILNLGARYHDIGLLAIPDTLLGAARALSPDECRIVSDHVRFGGQLLSLGYYDYPELLDIVWFHHERPDGSGPLGLRGELIPLPAQITSLAGAVESMHTGRPHRSAMPSGQIVNELHRCAGTQFSSVVVRLFSRTQHEIFEGLASLGSSAAGANATAASRDPQRRTAPLAHPSDPGHAKGEPAEAAPPFKAPDPTTRLGGVQHLTALPTAVCEVLMLAGNKYADRQGLTRAIEQDVALTAGILRLGNSSACGPRRGRITSVKEAVANVGFDVVKTMANSMKVLRNLGGESDEAVSYVKLWEHSFATALIARLLSSEDADDIRDTRYLNGLLHDVGKFVLVQHFPDCVPALVHVQTPEQEHAAAGIDHAQLGGKLLASWGVPPEVTQAVSRHHIAQWQNVGDPDGEAKAVIHLQVADGLALALGFESGFLDYLPRISSRLVDRCTPAQHMNLQETRQTILKQMQEAKSLLGMFQEQPAHAAADDPAAAPELPTVTYITAAPARLDFLALWLQQGKACSLHHHRMDSQDSEVDATRPVLLNLVDAEPRPASALRWKELLARHRGLLLASEAWAELIPETPAGWHSAFAPLTLHCLEACVQQLLTPPAGAT